MPILTFRCCLWPYVETVAKEIDAYQAKMLSWLMDVHPEPGEDIGEFVRRRCRRANTLTESHGRWSLAWAKSCTSFDGHVSRNTSGRLWPALLKPLRDRTWLMEKRASFAPANSIRANSWNAFAGRTNTRRAPGGVATRWEDGVVNASLALEQERRKQLLAGVLRPKRTRTKKRLELRHS